MQINVIPPEQVDFYWPAIERHIQASQNRPFADWSADAIRLACRSDESWRLLIIDRFDAAVVIRVVDDNLYVVSIGGTFGKGWTVEFFGWLQRIAKFLGLRYVTGGGRRGWIRVLGPLGFVHVGGLLLRCEIPTEIQP
jgi:hypothetical protein